MANNRLINTTFWTDNYISELSPIEKLVFIYLLTNTQTNLAGFYEINVKKSAFELDIEVSELNRILAKLQADHRLSQGENWLFLTNFMKHQNLNPSMQKNVEKIYQNAPEWIQNLVKKSIHYRGMNLTGPTQAVNRVSTASPQDATLNKTKLNKTKDKSKLNATPANADSAKPQEFDGSNLTAEQKKQYALAVKRDKEQHERVLKARERPAADISKIGDPNEIFGEGK